MQLPIIVVDAPPAMRLSRPKPPRWRCRRRGLWVCWWLGKHYATARWVRPWWSLAIHSPNVGTITWPHCTSLGAIRRDISEGAGVRQVLRS